MNQFGGNWTKEKIDILETYAKAYLSVFKNRPNDKLLYFDGFAGSGEILHLDKEGNEKTLKGAALTILGLDNPRPFDLYYFVEKEKAFANALEAKIKEVYPSKEAHVVSCDCNEKIIALSSFLKDKGKQYKTLGFIDPKGMQLEWKSIASLKGLHIDLWVLNPTSGANRLLKRDGNIDKAWLKRLNIFLGLSDEEILGHFYKQSIQQGLWGEASVVKERDAINKLHELYAARLTGHVFKYVSKPRVLRNTNGTILFHFFMATNNDIAIKIANSVVEPKFKL